MTPKRLNLLLQGTVGLSIVILLGCAYGANLALQSRSKHTLDAQARSQALDEQQRQLTKARADIEKYRSLATIAKHIVPQDKDQAQTIREIVNLAAEHGIKLGMITFPSSSLGGATGSSARGGKGTLSQLKPVAGIPGVYSLDITVQSDSASPAEYARFISFLDALEHNRRTALVSGISLQPDTANPGNLTFTLNLSEHIKP